MEHYFRPFKGVNIVKNGLPERVDENQGHGYPVHFGYLNGTP